VRPALRRACPLGEARDAVQRRVIQVMTTIPLADAKARLPAVLDDVRDTPVSLLPANLMVIIPHAVAFTG